MEGVVFLTGLLNNVLQSERMTGMEEKCPGAIFFSKSKVDKGYRAVAARV